MTHAPVEAVTRQRPDAIPALTGLRIIGAGWVVIVHFQETLYRAFPPVHGLEPLIRFGGFGVPLFFILSGFILWHNYGRASLLGRRETARFLWRRFARLWPVNAVTATAAVPLVYWSVTVKGYWGAPVPDWYSIQGYLASLFMVQEIGRHVPVYAWNQPAWTLTGEMVAYVIFPVIVAVGLSSRARRWERPWMWASAVAVLSIAVSDPRLLYKAWWLPGLIAMFTIGVCLRRVGRPSGVAERVAGVAQVLAPVAIVAVCFADFAEALVALLALWVWSLSSPSGVVVRIFSTRAFHVAGQASYSVYMAHWVVFGYGYILMANHPRIEAEFMAPFTIGLLVTVGATGWLVWRALETPARRFLNAAFDRRWPTRGTTPRESATRTPHA